MNSDGKLFKLPVGYGGLLSPFVFANLRYDWYLEIGSPPFTTPEEYYDVLKKMIAKHPTNANGDKTYALSYNNYMKPSWLMGAWGLLWEWSDSNAWKVTDDNEVLHWLNTSEGLDACLWLNQIHLDGLFDPDAFINLYDDWKAKNVNDRYAGFLGPWWMTWNGGHEVWQLDDPNWVETRRFAQYGLKASGVKKSTMTTYDSTSAWFTIITDKCKDPDGAFKWIDFTASDMGSKLLWWGRPNMDISIWDVNDDGTWAVRDKAVQDVIKGTIDIDIMTGKLGCEWMTTSHYGGVRNDGSIYRFGSDIALEHDPWVKMRQDNGIDQCYDSSAFRVDFMEDNPLTVVKQQLEDTILSGFTNIVFSKSQEAAKATFEQLRDSVNAGGMRDIEKFRTDSLRAKLAEWGE